MQNKFVSTTIILLIGSFITKIIGFIIRIYQTRIIGISGNSYLSIINPTYSLLTSIAVFSLPLSLSKIISERKYKSKDIISNALLIMGIIDISLIILMYFTKDFIAIKLLKNESVKYLLLAISLTLPFISLSSIIKGYFFGNQNMLPYAVSNVLEQAFRLLIFYLFLNKIYNYNHYLGIMFIILSNILSETFSVIIFMFFIPNKLKLSPKLNYYNKLIKDEIISLTTPHVLSRLIGNIFYFIEPIILIHFLKLEGFSSIYITSNYALYNIYSLSILMLPTFFIGAIETSLVPELTKLIKGHNYQGYLKRIKKSLIISLVIGLTFKIIIDIYGKELLILIYHNTDALNYLKLVNKYFFLYYLEAPISSIILSTGNNKVIFKTTVISNIIKLSSLVFLIKLGIGFNSLIISEFINIVYVIITNSYYIKRSIKALFA